MLLPEALHAPSHVGLLGAGHFVQCQGQWREQGVHDRAAALTLSSGVASRRQRTVSVRGTGAVTSVGSPGVPRRKMPYFCSARWRPCAFGTHVRRSGVDLLASENDLVKQGRSTLHFVFYVLVYGHG